MWRAVIKANGFMMYCALFGTELLTLVIKKIITHFAWPWKKWSIFCFPLWMLNFLNQCIPFYGLIAIRQLAFTSLLSIISLYARSDSSCLMSFIFSSARSSSNYISATFDTSTQLTVFVASYFVFFYCNFLWKPPLFCM